jgi:hypothetical protein
MLHPLTSPLPLKEERNFEFSDTLLRGREWIVPI